MRVSFPDYRWIILADHDAASSLMSQLRQCGITTEAEHDAWTGLSDDLEAKREMLCKWGCLVLEKDFEEVVAGALPDERLWEIINEARVRQGKDEIPREQFPGDKERQVEWLVDDRWTTGAWKDVIRHHIAAEHRDHYQPRVEGILATIRPQLVEIADSMIQENHWVTDTRDKWFADRLAGQGKLTVGIVLGEYLKEDEILNINGFHKIVACLEELQEKMGHGEG